MIHDIKLHPVFCDEVRSSAVSRPASYKTLRDGCLLGSAT